VARREKISDKQNAYSRWKGTIFSQKMKAHSTIDLIPTEFVNYQEFEETPIIVGP
jgi:hypothetical protein